MGKIQIPSVGGIRKVIKTGANAAAGTTISEIGSGEVSLAQLAMLLASLIPPPTGTIGSPTTATLVAKQGLGGGGPLIGSVPVYLTAPIPIGDSDMVPGEEGPPGRPGAAGIAGPSGTSGWTIPGEDGQDGEMGPPGIGNPGIQGATGAAGANGINGWTIPGEDGQDGETGPPGIGTPGAAGAVGAAGARGYSIPGDDGVEGESGAMILFGAQAAAIGFANPTAHVGLIAVNGSASTAMRSDAAPPLDQSISPTWTGTHIWSPTSAGAIPMTVNGGSSGNFIAQFQGISTAGLSNGVVVYAGTGSHSEDAFSVGNAAQSLTYFVIQGDGSASMGCTANTALQVNGAAANTTLALFSDNSATAAVADASINRSGSTANNVAQGPNLILIDTLNATETCLQQSGGQTELWQFNSSAWHQVLKVSSSGATTLTPISTAAPALTVTQASGQFVATFQGGTTASTASYGVNINAAGNAVNDICLRMQNAAGTVNLMTIYGNGVTIGGTASPNGIGTLVITPGTAVASITANMTSGTAGGIVINAGGVGDIHFVMNSAAAGQAVLGLSTNGTATAYIGTAGAANQLVTGSAAGDLCYRTQGGAHKWSGNSGAGIQMTLSNAGNLSAPNFTALSAAGAGTAGQITYGSSTATSASTTAGGATLPALAAGYIIVGISGTLRKIPYYAT